MNTSKQEDHLEHDKGESQTRGGGDVISRGGGDVISKGTEQTPESSAPEDTDQDTEGVRTPFHPKM